MSLTADQGVFRPDPVIDPEQVRSAVAGDRLAAGRLLAAVRPLVVRYCRTRMRGSWMTAEDIAQEVCLALLKALPTYDVNRADSFLAFVFRVAANRITDVYRAAACRPALSRAEVPDLPATDPGPEQRVLRQEQVDLLPRLLDSVTAQQREAVVLRLVVGLSVEETAVVMSLTVGAVRASQHRAVRRLRAAAPELLGGAR